MLDKIFVILAVGMVVTGTINTLTSKYADDSSAKDSQGKVTQFNHPYVQTLFMFMGEFLCLLAYKTITFVNKQQGMDRQLSYSQYGFLRTRNIVVYTTFEHDPITILSRSPYCEYIIFGLCILPF
jgi:hypothetical protein